MCGITGLFIPTLTDRMQLSSMVGAMNKALTHRGPDDEGIWQDPEVPLAFGQRRLSIVDLSPAGHQPMLSHSNRLVITYNGETYSMNELLPQLQDKGIFLKGHSDTELMVECFDHLGLDKTLPQLIGMFAFALWNRETKELKLVRDRLGIKPLYWMSYQSGIAFASELKALRVLEAPFEIDQEALMSYLKYGYVPAPKTIYKNVFKLQPGHCLTFKQGEEPSLSTFWNFKEVCSQKQTLQSEAEDLEELEDLLQDAISRRLVADVPVGAFLSGGIDSSLVVALAQKSSSNPLKTFSIGFEDQAYNEAPFAKSVAQHLKTDHHELIVTQQQAQDVIPLLSSMYDEPFSDSSQIPTYLVSKLARQHVKVSLSGDGGDEVFVGYSRYIHGEQVYKAIQGIPLPFMVGNIIQGISVDTYNKWAKFIPASKRPQRFGEKAHRLAKLLLTDSPTEFYQTLLHQNENPQDLIKGSAFHIPASYDLGKISKDRSLIQAMQEVDTITYLPDDILTKVDRASMSVSLEARVPLLDHRLVEWSYQKPLAFKLKNGLGKWPLRQILEKYVPKEYFDRPKTGFGIPLAQWLRGDLKAWAGERLFDSSLKELLDQTVVEKMWVEHQSGQVSHAYALWNLLMLQEWRSRWEKL